MRVERISVLFIDFIEAYQSSGTSNAREEMVSQKLGAGDMPLYLGSHQIP